MKKKLLAILLAVCTAIVCAFGLAACTESNTPNGDNTDDGTVETPDKGPSEGLEYTLNEDGESYCVSGLGTCEDTDLVIAKVYEEKPVTSIGEWALCEIDPDSGEELEHEITSVTIPDSVTSIGDGAFAYCSLMTSVIIGDSVTSIGDGAFWYCSELTSITIPEGVTYIGEGAFEGCSGLTSITIPDSVTKISYEAFGGCVALTSITIPAGVTSIRGYAFDGCSGLTSITFKGTTAQWKAIEKGMEWNSDTGDFTIICTDGKLDKDGNEITE